MIEDDGYYDDTTASELIDSLLDNPDQLERLCQNNADFATSPAAQSVKLLSANHWKYGTYLSKLQPLWRETSIAKSSAFLAIAPGHIVKNIIQNYNNLDKIGELPTSCWSKYVYDEDTWFEGELNEDNTLVYPCDGQEIHGNSTFAYEVWKRYLNNDSSMNMPDYFAHPDFLDGLFFSDLIDVVSQSEGNCVRSMKCAGLINKVLSSINLHSDVTVHRLFRVAGKVDNLNYLKRLAETLAENAIPLLDHYLHPIDIQNNSPTLLQYHSPKLYSFMKDTIEQGGISDVGVIPYLMCMVEGSLSYRKPQESLVPQSNLINLLSRYAIDNQASNFDNLSDVFKEHADPKRYPLTFLHINETAMKIIGHTALESFEQLTGQVDEYEPTLY